MNINHRIIFLFVLLSYGNFIYSQVETVIGGVTIQSDNSDINFKTGVRTYSGNVKINHLNFYLEADEVKEYRDGSKIIKIIAVGDPAKFWQVPPETADLKNGTAHHIEYLAEKRILNLTTYNVVDLNGNNMQGENATYHFQ